MSKALILTLSAEENGPILWGLGQSGAGKGGPSAKVETMGRLSGPQELSSLPLKKADEIVVVVPGGDVLMRTVTVPAKREHEVRAAIPFLLEDDLSSDPDELHFAVSAPGEDNERRVAVVSRETMARWRETLAALGETPYRLVADFDLLERPQAGTRVVDRGDRVIVLPSKGAPATTDRMLAPMVLPSMMTDAGPFEIESDDRAALLGDSAPRAYSAHASMSDSAFLSEAMTRFSAGAFIDLVQGGFARGAAWSMSPTVWRRAAILAAVTLAAYGISLGIQGWRYHQMADDMIAETETTFRAAFPEVRRVVNPQAQMKAKLAALETGGSDQFLALSSVLYASLQDLPAIQIRDLRFIAERGTLSASLSYGAFQDLEALKAAVTRLGGSLSEGGSRQSGERIVGDVTIGLK